MQFTTSGNDVLTSLGGLALNHGVRLGKLLEALHKLGKVGSVLHRHGHTHHRGHGELHGLEGTGALKVGDGTRLHKVGIDTDQTTGVTGGNIGDGLGVTTHHDHNTLDGLGEEVGLLAGNVVGTKDTDLLSSAHLTGEHTAESSKSVVGTGNHLGHVHHKRSTIAGVAGTDGVGSLVVERTVVEGLHTVSLGAGRGRQVHHNHLKDGISSGEPLLHDSLEEGLSGEGFALVLGKSNTDVGSHVEGLGYTLLVELVVHNSLEHRHNGVHDESNEGALGAGGLVDTSVGIDSGGVDPLGLSVLSGEHPVTPKLLGHLLLGGVELGGVHLGEHLQGETPLVKTRSEGNGTLGGVHLPIHVTESVGVDDDVHVLNSVSHVLVDLLTSELELEKGSVDLVHHEAGLHALSHGLTEHGTSLHGNTLNGVNDDKGTISHTEGSSHFRGEINVTRRVDQVDQVGVVVDLDVTDSLLSHRGGFFTFVLDHLTSGHVVLEKHTDTGGLDGNTTLLLILTSISVSGSTSVSGGDNSGLAHKGIGQG
mmetsp:Transcript_109648/g.236083  ORF Transcript_109648/g.236083 Transcript_109648/m.236083 type:complete len:535 (+) Transcript_109648:1073-2677(+)